MSCFWVYDIPSWLFALILIGAFVVFSVGGMIVTRPLARRMLGPPPACNDVVGDVLQAAGVFYGITLGLIAVGAWTNYGDLDTKVSREAAALGALYRDASCVPEPHRSALCDTLRRYTRYTIDEAWPAQRAGIVPKPGVLLMNEFQERLAAFKPADLAQQAYLTQLFAQYNGMMELRRLRLDAVGTGMPSIIWVVVFAGAAVNIALVWCFVMERQAAHAALLTLLGILVALLVFLTAALDHPFRGPISVGPDAFELIYDQLMRPHTVE
jgi:hypothetical protein